MRKKKEYTPFWKGFREEIANLKEVTMVKYLIEWMSKASSKRTVIIILVLTAGQPLFSLLWPFFIKVTADSLSGAETPNWINSLSEQFGLSVWITCVILAGVSHYIGRTIFDIASLIARNVAYRTEKVLKDLLYFHVVFAPLGIHDSFNSGALTTTLTSAPADVRVFLYSKGFTDAFPLLYQNLFIFVNFILIDVLLFGFTVPFMTVAFVIYVIGARAINRNEMSIWKAEKKVRSYLNDMVANISIIKTFRKEQDELDMIDQENVLQLEANRQQARNWRVLTRTSDAWNLVLWIVVSIYIGGQIQSGQHGVGTMFQVSALYLMFTSSFFKVGIMYSTFRSLVIRMKDVIKILNSEPEVLDDPNKGTLASIQHGITFRNLEFAYELPEEEGGNRVVLKGLSCEIPIGKATLLAGVSGSGKTTLFKIMLGFYKQQSGDVLYDNHLSTDLTLRSIRSQFSMVDQDAWLKPGTLYSNIEYGSPVPVTEEDVYAAAITAGIHEDILKMPLGYYTEAGEFARRVSGGQRQRIAIARALISKAPIIFFDEPLSKIDAPTRAQVWSDIRKMMQGKTMIVVSHIPIDVDHVIMIKEGIVIGSGSDKDLWTTNPEFQELYPEHHLKAA